MLNLDTYKNRDIQNMLALLAQAEAESITDIRFVREQLQVHINKSYRERRMPQAVKERRNATMRKTCPSCSSGVLVGRYKFDGLIIARCSKKCGYSEVIA